MEVTEIEKFGKYKYKVFLDGEFAFWLYWKELQCFGLKEHVCISKDTYEKILNEVILQKAKNKAIALLQYMNRTEQELRQKLKMYLYPSDVIEQVIAYLYDYNYLDDERYVECFIRCNKNNHSRRWMERKLVQKGIALNGIQQYFEDDYSEENVLRKALEKKMRGKRIDSQKEKEKVMAYLFRQGFSINGVRQVLKEYMESQD